MHWTDISSGRTNRTFQRLMTAFGDRADEIVDKINADNGEEVATRVATLCLNNGYEPSTSQARAREIMGRNMFGIEEAMKHLGVTLSKRDLAYLGDIPWSEDVLIACKDTHILVAVSRLSVLDVRGIAKKHTDQTLFYSQDWYDKEAFTMDKGAIGWQLVRKTAIENSTSKNWTEQQALLSKDEETPKAQVMVYTIIGHYLATGERLFEKLYVRCSDLDSDGVRVIVGDFDAKGLVAHWSDSHRDESIGLSSARKSDA